MLERRAFLSALLVGTVACRSRAPAGKTLAAADPVDKGFDGCTGWGKKPAAGQAIHLQPDAKMYDATRCIVSGVAFVVTPESPTKSVAGTPYYFCCASCLDYFGNHGDEVLRKRGIVSA
jgi:hypothetical protein